MDNTLPTPSAVADEELVERSASEIWQSLHDILNADIAAQTKRIEQLWLALETIRDLVSKRQLPITNQVYEIAVAALVPLGAATFDSPRESSI